MQIIAADAHISALADLEDSVRGSRLVIGPGVRIDSFVKIKFTGGTGDCDIGDHSYINSGVVIYSGNGVKIGRHVLIGPNCSIVPVNHAFRDKNRLIHEQGFTESKGGIVIEDDVWLGAGVTVLDGSVVGKGAVIGAGALVRGCLPPYGVYLGNPARKVGDRA